MSATFKFALSTSDQFKSDSIVKHVIDHCIFLKKFNVTSTNSPFNKNIKLRRLEIAGDT